MTKKPSKIRKGNHGNEEILKRILKRQGPTPKQRRVKTQIKAIR